MGATSPGTATERAGVEVRQEEPLRVGTLGLPAWWHLPGPERGGLPQLTALRGMVSASKEVILKGEEN